MLIVNQTKDLVVNMDNATYLWIEKKSCSIKCKVVGEDLGLHLGTYQSLDGCKKVLDEMINANMLKCSEYRMPLGGQVI